jgi:hypothetical protein
MVPAPEEEKSTQQLGPLGSQGLESSNMSINNLLIEEQYVRFEAFTAVTMKNVFWEIKPPFVLHRRHITSPLQSPAG